MTTTKKATLGPWTDDENRAICELYFQMLEIATTAPGAKYKAHMIRAAQGTPKPGDEDYTGDASDYAGKLADRSKGSIEAKLMNVSGVLRDLGRDDVSMAAHGYVCMSNYQADLKLTVIGLLAVRDEAVRGGFDNVGTA